jgi:hypothetical protein
MIDAMAKVAASLKVGTPDEEGAMLGPIQNEMQYEKVKTFFQDSKDKATTSLPAAETSRRRTVSGFNPPSSTTLPMTARLSRKNSLVLLSLASLTLMRKRLSTVLTTAMLVLVLVSGVRMRRLLSASLSVCKPAVSSSTRSRSPLLKRKSPLQSFWITQY